jgi:hypothetical protein
MKSPKFLSLGLFSLLFFGFLRLFGSLLLFGLLISNGSL